MITVATLWAELHEADRDVRGALDELASTEPGTDIHNIRRERYEAALDDWWGAFRRTVVHAVREAEEA